MHLSIYGERQKEAHSLDDCPGAADPGYTVLAAFQGAGKGRDLTIALGYSEACSDAVRGSTIRRRH